MNVRKNVDYSQMYAGIDEVMTQDLPQMELYCCIGRIVCTRSEKGAAVMASEYLIANYPDAKGFSPRSLRRMRDFYRTYENHPDLMSRAMKLGWIQNVVIMEADLTMEQREWYMKAEKQFAWSKTELIAQIAANVHEEIVLTIEEEGYCNMEQEDKKTKSNEEESSDFMNTIHQSVQIIRKWWLTLKKGRRRCKTMRLKIFVVKWTVFM